MHANNAHGVYEIIILVINRNRHKPVLDSVVNLKVCLTLHGKQEIVTNENNLQFTISRT